MHVELGQSVQNVDGTYPSICASNTTVVQVNNSTGLSKQLCYQVGKVKAGEISWENRACFYDYGLYPRVAINKHGTVVEVHEAQFVRDIYYRVGVVDTFSQKIEWSDSRYYDSGLAPAVALLDDNTVISVHQTSAFGSYATYYRLGTVDVKHKNIKWGHSISYGRGRELALAANQDTVVEVHKSTWGNRLRYHVGKLDGNEIKWGEDTHYDEGWNPSIGINSVGHVVEVHTSTILRRLYRRIAVADTRAQNLGWVGDAVQYDMGAYPSVCLNDNDDKNIVEAHESNFGSSIWCRTGTLKPSN